MTFESSSDDPVKPVQIEAHRSLIHSSTAGPVANNDPLASIQVVWSEDILPLLGYELSSVEPTTSWWLDRIHSEDVQAVKSTLTEHLNHSYSPSSVSARLWYHEYRFLRGGDHPKRTAGKGKGGKEDDEGNRYILIGERMATSRLNGYPVQSESYLFDQDLRAEALTQRHDLDDKANFRIVLENMDSGLFMMNSAGYVTFMNKAAERLTGFTYEEISKVTFHEAVHSLRPDLSPYPLHECPVYGHQRDNIAVREASEVFIHRDGRFFPIVYSVAPLFGGYEHGAVIEFRDVSQQKAMEEERVEALVIEEQLRARAEHDKMLRGQMSDFVDYVCHEIRNPLHGISANTHFLSDSISEIMSMLKMDHDIQSTKPTLETLDSLDAIFETAQSSLRSIEQCVLHQSAILNNVLDLSRLEAGKMQLVETPFSPWDSAMQAIQIVNAKASERNLILDLRAGSDSVKSTQILGDPTALRQIYLNLLTNACKFAHANSTIITRMAIETDQDGRIATVNGSVTDHGVGMDEEDLSKLFQRFSQANRRVSSDYGGSGLGLNISRELVKLNKGELTVHSQKSVGSTFSFYAIYPIVAKASSSTLFSPSPALHEVESLISKSNGLHLDDVAHKSTTSPQFTNILCAEDNSLNRKILSKYLSKTRTTILTCDGQECFEYYAEHYRDIHLIVMDCEMPRLTGREATKKIREFESTVGSSGGGRRVPIIGLSGNARRQQIDDAKESGMDDYMSKPCSQKELEDMISKWERLAPLQNFLTG